MLKIYDNISLDMIKITGDIEPELFKTFMEGYQIDTEIEYRYNTSHKSYNHNFIITRKEYSYFIGYGLNTKSEYLNRVYIDFNPNKVDYINDKYLRRLLGHIIFLPGKFKISSADIALDYYDINTNNLIIDKGRKENYREFYYKDTGKTIYLGNPGSNGSIKIYDKAREEKRNQKINREKTRYEVTLKINETIQRLPKWKCKVDLVKVYSKNSMDPFTEKISPTDRLLIYSIQNGFPMTHLTYEQRKKYEKLEKLLRSEDKKIEPNSTDIEKTLVDNVMLIFNNILRY